MTGAWWHVIVRKASGSFLLPPLVGSSCGNTARTTDRVFVNTVSTHQALITPICLVRPAPSCCRSYASYVRLVRRTMLILGIALASGAVVLTLCYVGVTLNAGQPLYACHPVQEISGPFNVDIPTTAQESCGISPVAWWVKAAGVSAFVAGGTETVLVLRRRRGPAKRARRDREPVLVP